MTFIEAHDQSIFFLPFPDLGDRFAGKSHIDHFSQMGGRDPIGGHGLPVGIYPKLRHIRLLLYAEVDHTRNTLHDSADLFGVVAQSIQV
jgi:hypothetical protein